jgi:hypothetical protein
VVLGGCGRAEGGVVSCNGAGTQGVVAQEILVCAQHLEGPESTLQGGAGLVAD